jgi:hypothetical protein
MGWVDLSQRKNRNGYYHSFKTQFGGRFVQQPQNNFNQYIFV